MSNTSKQSFYINLVELTPSKFKCSVGACPAVYESEDGNLIIIGKKPSKQISSQIENKIGDDELAIVIDRELLANIT